MRVISNYHPREVIQSWELTDKERKEFDYLDWQAIEEGSASATFFRYRDQIYDLGEFMEDVPPTTPKRKFWHCFASDSYFSGLLIHYVNPIDDEAGIIVGLALA